MSQVIIPKKVFPKEIIEKEPKLQEHFDRFPYELDSFQKHAAYAITKQEIVLLSAPTGCGKTNPAIVSILDAISRGKRAIYTSPIKVLSNQKFAEFTEKFPDISFGILTGDIKLYPDAQCIIMTTEILRNLLYNSSLHYRTSDGEELVFTIDVENEVGTVIFDEVHYINDRDRGRIWEECLIMLPPKIQLTLLSATIESGVQFAEWLSERKQKPVHFISIKERVVPLTHYLYFVSSVKADIESKKDLIKKLDKYGNKCVEIVSPSNEFDKVTFINYQKMIKDYVKWTKKRHVPKKMIINSVIDMLSRKKLVPALFFVFSRKKCEQFAGYVEKCLNTPEEQIEVSKILTSKLHSLEDPDSFKNLRKYEWLLSLAQKGIAVHHSGLIPILKEMIEILFSKGLIKVLFATETFAVGVNMPTKTVLFTDISKYTTYTGMRNLETHEYLQMSGRAGRRGIDKIGNVILLPNLFRLSSHHIMQSMMCGKSQSIRSAMTFSYQFVLSSLLTDPTLLEKTIKSSLLYRENNKQINILNREIKERETKYKKPTFKVDLELLEEYYSYMNPKGNIDPSMTMFIKKKKPSKKQQRRVVKLKKVPNLLQEYKLFVNFKNVEKSMNKLKYERDYYNKMLTLELEKVFQFLSESDYIEIPEKSADTIVPYQFLPEHILVKGRVAQNINEVNEILMTELVMSGLLEECSPQEIGAIISIFLAVRVMSDSEIISVDELSISDNVKEAIDYVNKESKRFYDLEKYLGKEIEYSWDISLNLVEITYKWLSGNSFKDIIPILPTFEGNFIKNMLKVRNIAIEMERCASLLGNTVLQEILLEIPSLVIRDVVTTDSLYLHM